MNGENWKTRRGSSAEHSPRFLVFQFSPFNLRSAKELSL